MPRINIFILLITLFLSSGCLESEVKNHHGLNMTPRSEFTYRGVVDRSIHLKFEIKKGPISKITARIEIDHDYNYPLNFEWKLGQDVQLTGGSLNGTIEKMQKNIPLEIELEVSGFNTDTPRFVRFEVLGTNPQKRTFADGVVSSSDKSFEKIVQEIEAYKKENP